MKNRCVVRVLGAVLMCAAAGPAWAGVVAEPAVTDIAVAGGSFPVGVSLDTAPLAVTATTFSLDPTWLTFTKDPGEVEFIMSLVQVNATAEAVWEGLDFELSGGVFTSEPRPTLGGMPGMILDLEATRAKLLVPGGIGPTSLVDLELRLGGGTSAVLTVTPIVPEPAAGLLLLVTTPLLGRRRARG